MRTRVWFSHPVTGQEACQTIHILCIRVSFFLPPYPSLTSLNPHPLFLFQASILCPSPHFLCHLHPLSDFTSFSPSFFLPHLHISQRYEVCLMRAANFLSSLSGSFMFEQHCVFKVTPKKEKQHPVSIDTIINNLFSLQVKAVKIAQ